MFDLLFRQKIESHRCSKSIFWSFLVLIKDLLWLLMSKTNKKIIERRTFTHLKSIKKIQPVFCDIDSDTEIHTVICKKYVYMYMACIKSFLKFYNKCSIVVHSDGSLTEKEFTLLEEHIQNIRIIGKISDELYVQQVIADRPFIKKYRQMFKNSKILTDYVILSKSKKIIILDSDILFFKRPIEIINWAKHDSDEILYLHEQNPYNQRKFFKDLNIREEINMCAGIFCFFTDIFDLDFIEHCLSKVNLDWWTGQNMYATLVMRNLSRHLHDISPLDQVKYQSPNGINPMKFSHSINDAIARHYWTSTGIQKVYIDDVSLIF